MGLGRITVRIVATCGFLAAATNAFSSFIPRSQVSRSSSLLRNMAIEVLTDEDEEKFKIATKRLCEERNLPLQKVKNARDLASIRNSPIKPGKVFRTGKLGGATEADRRVLLQELGMKTLVDLRSPTELKDDPDLLSCVFTDFTDLVWAENKRGKEGCLKELKEGESPIKKKKRSFPNPLGKKALEEEDELCDLDCDDPASMPASKMLENTAGRKERHFVSLMNEFKYVRGTVSKLRKRDLAQAIFKSPGAVISKRVWDSLKKPFIREINDGGLIMLNELLLRFGAPGIKYVLDLCADKERHPVAFYCTAGKDRTGMISAIILSVCGVTPEDIVEDYTLSANVYAEMNDHQAMVGALSQRSLDPKTFLGAPPQVMSDILISIEQNYGSVEGYCDWIGFDAQQREKLRQALLND
jgi:protein tyrosine/serine phosphatase